MSYCDVLRLDSLNPVLHSLAEHLEDRSPIRARIGGRSLRLVLCLVVLSLSAQRVGAQTPPSASETVPSIHADDLARYLTALRGDSLRERPTPSRGLERAAKYVAEQFAKLGLTPVRIGNPDPDAWGTKWGTPQGDDSTFLQRYPLPGELRPDYALSLPRLYFGFVVSNDGHPIIDAEGARIGRSFETEASFALDTVARALPPDFGVPSIQRSPLLLAGPHTLRSVQQAQVAGRIVLYVPLAGGDTVVGRHITHYLAGASAGVVIPLSEDSATFARRRLRSQTTVIVDDYLAADRGARWAAYIRSERLATFLIPAGVDVVQARTAAAPLIRELPLTITLGVQVMTTDTATSPNVLGGIAGTHFPNQHILITARLDQTNSADDNAAGIAGLLALAHAFSQPNARPRRSVIFAAVSGSRNGFWGSKYHALAAVQAHVYSANLNLDQISSDAGDSVVVDGLGEIKLANSLQWMAAEHPELHLTVVEGGSIFEPTSDHFVFARRAVPGLSFRGHPDRAPELPADQDTERLARFVRFAFYTGQEMANGMIPRWSEVGRKRLTQVLGENR